MPTSERFVDTPFLKRFVAINALVPLALLAWDAWHGRLGVNGVNFVIRTTGMIGLVLLTASLIVTPVRELTGWGRVIATRRGLGVIAFAYLALHFTVFFVFDREASISSTWHEIVTRRYLWFGTGALALMAPLALTSTDAMVARLGATWWKRLHRLAYVIAIGAATHYYLLVKSDVTLPLVFAGVIGLLLLYRVASHYVRLRAAARGVRTQPTPSSAGKPPRPWSGELVVSRVFQETPDVKTFRLAPVGGGPLPFTFAAGQYLNLALTIAGKRVNRSYTIASSPTRSGYCEISVKAAGNGHGSRHLHDQWREGQRIRVSAPAGSFVCGPRVTRLVMIAGGIGITPMMSMVRSLTDQGWPGELYLLYSVRTVADIAFRDELAWLAPRFPNLHVRIVVTRDPATTWDGPRGPITREAIAAFVPDIASGPVFLCGPGPMMTAMRQILIGLGVGDTEILQEAFVSRPPVEATASAASDTPMPTAGDASIVFTRTGTSVDAPGVRTILEAAEDAGVAIPFECRSGICGQCKTMLVSGRVVMEVEDALSVADRARGLILACQARPLDRVEVEA